MELTTLLLLTLLAFGFVIGAGLGNDRRFLLGAGGMFIIIGSMLFTAGGITTTDGRLDVNANVTASDTSIEPFSSTNDINTTVTDVTNTTTRRRVIDTQYPFPLSNSIALVYIAMGLYSLFVGAFSTTSVRELIN